MRERYVDFLVKEDGTWEAEAVGFEGRACLDFGGPLEALLGEVRERTAKPELRRPPLRARLSPQG